MVLQNIWTEEGLLVNWIMYPIHEDVLLTTRMHLNQEQASKLVKVLNVFIETGELKGANDEINE